MEKRRKKEGKGRKTGEIKSRGRAGDDGNPRALIFLSPRLYSFNYPLLRLSKKPLRRRENLLLISFHASRASALTTFLVIRIRKTLYIARRLPYVVVNVIDIVKTNAHLSKIEE